MRLVCQNGELIGEEISPDKNVLNSLDILAYDVDTSSLVVIELKREKNKLQLLQALSYAAMVSRWDQEDLVSKIQQHHSQDYEELMDLISSNELSGEVRVVLVAEGYDPEVIITAHWLSSNYEVPISAFAVALHEIEDQIFLTVDQRYPLRELDEAYESRRRPSKRTQKSSAITWEEVVPKLTYSFAERGIALCRKYMEGDPNHRRFLHIRKQHDGFDVTLYFRRLYVNVYLKGIYEGDQELLRSKFSSPIEIIPWRDGCSFRLTEEKQFDEVVDWLCL